MSIQVFGARPSPQLQTKNITPSSSTQYVTPSIGYDGLSQVTVNGDSNLISQNIKNRVSIFGVNRNYERTQNSYLDTSVNITTSSKSISMSTNSYSHSFSKFIFIVTPTYSGGVYSNYIARQVVFLLITSSQFDDLRSEYRRGFILLSPEQLNTSAAAEIKSIDYALQYTISSEGSKVIVDCTDVFNNGEFFYRQYCCKLIEF